MVGKLELASKYPFPAFPLKKKGKKEIPGVV
jgi:hypothetical protein